MALLKPDKLTGDFKKTIQVFFEGSPMPVELTVEAKLLEEHEAPSVQFVEMDKASEKPFQITAVVE